MICKFHHRHISQHMHKDKGSCLQWFKSVSRVSLVSFFNILIHCCGAVDDMANIIVAQLLNLDAVDPNKDIVMYVNSPGGSVTAGKRYSLPNSRIMIHQPLGGAQGGQTDIDIQANEMLHHKAYLNGYLSCHTGQSPDKINQYTDHDFFMSAKEYGLIDSVIMNPLKALQPLAATASP